MVEGIVKRDEKRRKRIQAAGIDYECPALVSSNLLVVNYLVF
jgi:nucleolar protein 15